jgi:hypothetical protein
VLCGRLLRLLVGVGGRLICRQTSRRLSSPIVDSRAEILMVIVGWLWRVALGQIAPIGLNSPSTDFQRPTAAWGVVCYVIGL